MNTDAHPLKKVWLPLFCLGLTAYFSYHILCGKRGMFSWRQVNSKITVLNGRLGNLKRQSASLENSVSRLRSRSLDPDLLDEQIRKILGWNEKDEIVIVDPSYKF
ncbi:MAG: septum formation initiator family protein [Holosporales bacterium]|nr:septum formation initiator family protein [Holosporales bacterium]